MKLINNWTFEQILLRGILLQCQWNILEIHESTNAQKMDCYGVRLFFLAQNCDYIVFATYFVHFCSPKKWFGTLFLNFQNQGFAKKCLIFHL